MKRRSAPYLFVAPWLILFCLFMAWPLVRSLYLALHRPVAGGDLVFDPLANVSFLVQDQLVWRAILNTFYFACLYLALQVPMSLGLALLLDRRDVRARGFFRLAFFSTHLVGSVFVAVIANIILGSRRGLMNQLLMMLGSEPVAFLSKPGWVMPMIVLSALWLGVGYGMIYMLAALQSVDRELYDAASVDGAGPVARFMNVTLPGIARVLSFLTLIGFVGALQLFELPYVMFQGFGPGFRAVTIVGYLFSTGFEVGDLPYASTVGWALAILVGMIALIQMRLGRRFSQ